MRANNKHDMASIFDIELKGQGVKKRFFGDSEDNQEQRKALLSVLMEAYNNELTQKQHTAFDYVYFKNMTVTEAAKNMGITQSSCSKLLKRGRERLSRILSYGYFPVWKSTN